MSLEYHQDAKTKAGHLKQLLSRPDAAPRDPNPVRRFREELRLTREVFAELMGIPVETLRAWERHEHVVIPNGPRMERLVELARRNYYPLYIGDVVRFAEKATAQEGTTRKRASKGSRKSRK